MQICTRCLMPSTQAGITFDERGVCNGCRAFDEKMDIDWEKREKILLKLLEKHRDKGAPWDCIVPLSGGKDSAFTLYMMKCKYGMTPLAVTFNYGWMRGVGKKNLATVLEELTVDHVMFTPNDELVRKLARVSLKMFGDQCWHCHAGIGALPAQMAVRYNIPLVVWSESPAEHPAENPVSYQDFPQADYTHYYTRFVKGFTPDKMVDCDDSLDPKDLKPFVYPSPEELERIGHLGIFLGSYIPWNTRENVELLKRELGWQEADYEGCYLRYDRIECLYEPVHDYLKFIKRGFGHTQDRASIDIRNRVFTREEGIRLVQKHDGKQPNCLTQFLEYVSMSDEEFMEHARRHAALVRKPLQQCRDGRHVAQCEADAADDAVRQIEQQK